MSESKTPSPAVFKYPMGDQARQFIFACDRAASRLSLSHMEWRSLRSESPAAASPKPAERAFPLVTGISRS